MAEQTSCLTRRGVLRGLSLATLAVASTPLLNGCGSDASGGGGGSPSAAGYRLVSSGVARSAAPQAAIPAAVAGIHGLGAGLYAALSSRSGNLALSPFSIAVALGLTVNGAAGPTQTEMLGVLGAPDITTLDDGLNALTAYVESLAGQVPGPDGGATADLLLDSANGLFGQRGVTWETRFLDTLARDFGTGVLAVDWSGSTEAARRAVNAWTAKQTRDKIPEILTAGSVGVDTRLVLVNALYLKAPWRQRFEKGSTSPADFVLEDGGTVRVPTMRQTLVAPYAAGEGYEAVQLAYSGDRVAMTLLLPDADRPQGLDRLVGAGALPGVLDTLSSAGPTQVMLSLPTWTYRTQVGLATQLAALGMPTAFTDDADLSAMTTQEQLSISGVLHEVVVAVDENGTEAAAVTAVVAGATSAPADGVELVFDRPFVFVIHDVEHGTPLFVGRVADPRS